MAKGSAFERKICKQLSLWWTNNEREDIFWRTGGSGGRATTRAKKNKTTHGQYGDICATDPIGEPLIKTLTIEIKRGYSKFSIADLFDKSPSMKKQCYELFIEQAIQSHKDAKSYSWLLIVCRDRRLPLVFMTMELRNRFENLLMLNGLDMEIYIDGFKFGNRWQSICCWKFADFLKCVTPKMIKKLYRYNNVSTK